MPGIQPKKGKCMDCGPDKPEQYLTAKRCKYHYWMHRSALRNDKRKAAGINLNAHQDKKDLDNWFLFQISNMPDKCENCSEPLVKFAPWAARSYVAHILPKRTFKSVQMHVLNRVFLCLQCHGDYDNRGWAKTITMPVWRLAQERLQVFAPLIHPDEMNHMPDILLKLKLIK